MQLYLRSFGQKSTFRGRSARALVEAEAEVENAEKLGEAAMQFFYGSKVIRVWGGDGGGVVKMHSLS